MVLWINNKNHLNKLANNLILANKFHDLCILFSEPKNNNSYDSEQVIDCRVSRFTGYLERNISREKGILLKEFKDILVDAINESYNDGKENGKNLLKGLNNGSLTLKDFEQ